MSDAALFEKKQVKYFSPKTSISRWLGLLVFLYLYSIMFILFALKEKSISGVIMSMPLLGLGCWLSKILFLRVTRPSVEILNDRVVVQNKFGRFIEVAPFFDYRLVFSADFLAFRKGKENDITVELEHIKKEEFETLKSHLTNLPFQDYAGDADCP